MRSVQSSIDIASSPDDVFALLIDTRRHPDLVHGYLSQERGPDILFLGAEFRWRMRSLGITITTDSRMSESDRPRRYQEQLHMRGVLAGTLTKTLEPSSRGTRLTWRLDYEPVGVLGRVQDLLLRGSIARTGLTESLRLVRQVAEREYPMRPRASLAEAACA